VEDKKPVEKVNKPDSIARFRRENRYLQSMYAVLLADAGAQKLRCGYLAG